MFFTLITICIELILIDLFNINIKFIKFNVIKQATITRCGIFFIKLKTKNLDSYKREIFY